MSPARKSAPAADAAPESDAENAGQRATADAAGSPTADSPATDGPTAGRPTELPADIAALSYEAARDQLVEVVRRLESGQGGLEDSIGLWERGELLATRCQQWLDGARDRLEDAMSARGRSEGGS